MSRGFREQNSGSWIGACEFRNPSWCCEISHGELRDVGWCDEWTCVRLFFESFERDFHSPYKTFTGAKKMTGWNHVLDCNFVWLAHGRDVQRLQWKSRNSLWVDFRNHCKSWDIYSRNDSRARKIQRSGSKQKVEKLYVVFEREAREFQSFHTFIFSITLAEYYSYCSLIGGHSNSITTKT